MKKEEFKIDGKELYGKVKSLMQEGTTRKISIKNESGETLLEIPLILGAVGAVIAPVLAAVAAIAALVTKCTIVVERESKDESSTSADTSKTPEEKE
jgi:hypothetical protein